MRDGGSTPRVLIIGFGALARWLVQSAADDRHFQIAGVLVKRDRESDVRRLLPDTEVVYSADGLGGRFDFALEVASRDAVTQHVPELLMQGIKTAIASTGALADPQLYSQLVRCAETGHTTLRLLSGAIGGLDLLAAHRAAGLKHVAYTGRKPPGAWKGASAPAESDKEVTIFTGTAREAARAFPANANVAATIAIAGAGLDATRVRLLSDPKLSENVHLVEAQSEAGHFRLEMVGRPLPANPSTSALTAFSALGALQQLSQPLLV